MFQNTEIWVIRDLHRWFWEIPKTFIATTVVNQGISDGIAINVKMTWQEVEAMVEVMAEEIVDMAEEIAIKHSKD
jgi:hypothetical protein